MVHLVTRIICSECGEGHFTPATDAHYSCTVCGSLADTRDFILDDDMSLSLVDGLLHVVTA